MNKALKKYFETLSYIQSKVVVTDQDGHEISWDSAVGQIIDLAHVVRDSKNKIMFVGNGGSSAIASHMAIDYSKNGRLPSIAFNDSAALTCLSNDLGYESVFSEQIALHGRKGDLLIAISSSGKSTNILRAVSEAKTFPCSVVTMSGFSPKNPLRKEGILNWYVNSEEYGFVELSHLALCHAVLDIEMGWGR